MIEVFQFPCLKDNYGYILCNSQTKKCVCIDTPDAKTILNFAQQNELKISQIWNTHWHPDHAGGNKEIAEFFNAQCFGPAEIASHGFLNDVCHEGGDCIDFDGVKVEIIDLSGHTIGQIGYYLPSENIAFVGDALFALGCGRLFEGSAEMAFNSLKRLSELSDETKIYCAHEYSLANAAFCESLKLSNPKLGLRINEIKELRAKNMPTIPTTLKIEMETNPFLLADFEQLKADLALENESDLEVFTHIRKLKDNF